jgi:hypothetical protein
MRYRPSTFRPEGGKLSNFDETRAEDPLRGLCPIWSFVFEFVDGTAKQSGFVD